MSMSQYQLIPYLRVKDYFNNSSFGVQIRKKMATIITEKQNKEGLTEGIM